MIDRLLWLVYAHAIGDMALQGQTIAVYKNWHNPFIANGSEIPHYWLFVLLAHALITGACASVAVRNAKAGLFIATSHFFIDFASTNGLPFVFDQGLHSVALVLTAQVFGENYDDLKEPHENYETYQKLYYHGNISPSENPKKKHTIGTAKAHIKSS